IAQVVGTNPRGVEATLRRARARFRLEVSRAESAEVARATCRRVLRLVGDDPQASRSEEAAAHLAHCADCRRQARLGVDGRPSVGTTVATASEAAAPPQVESVPSTSLLFRASPNSPVTAGPATAAQPSTPALTTPSLLGASPSGAGPLDVLSQLGLAPGGDVVASALTNVSSVSNILADQLNQVAQ